jgi:nucleoside-diphosphate-sugar epimerase
MRHACVFGAAGFIGSNVSAAFVAAGWSVTAVDGFLPRTTAARAHLDAIADRITLVDRRVEDITSLPSLIEGAHLIVDCMGWTRHWEAKADPRYDLDLNVASHLPLLTALADVRPPLTIYLGSSHQYGRAHGGAMTENTPLQPIDEQGIHKAAADHHYRLAAERHGLHVVSLRFGNTFGLNQPINGRDLGLIGEFIVAALNNKAITVYGHHRSRNIVYAADLASTILRLADAEISGFTPLNFGGLTIPIHELAEHVVRAANTGTIEDHPLPPEVAAMDIVAAHLDSTRIEQLLGPLSLTPLPQALAVTVGGIRHRLRL